MLVAVAYVIILFGHTYHVAVALFSGAGLMFVFGYYRHAREVGCTSKESIIVVLTGLPLALVALGEVTCDWINGGKWVSAANGAHGGIRKPSDMDAALERKVHDDRLSDSR